MVKLEHLIYHIDKQIDNISKNDANEARKKARIIAYVSIKKKLANIGPNITLKDIDNLNATEFMKYTLKQYYNTPINETHISIINKLAKIHGLGLVKAKQLYKLGVRKLEDLKTQKIFNTLPIETQAYLQYNVLDSIPRKLIDKLYVKLKKNKVYANTTFEIAGSYRRQAAYSSDIDIVSTGNLDDLIGAIKNNVVTIYSKGPDKASLLYSIDNKIVKLDIMVCKPISYPYFLLYLTGSKEHNVKMRGIAKAKKLLLNQLGLYDGDKLIPAKTERDIFDALNVKYVEPKDR